MEMQLSIDKLKLKRDAHGWTQSHLAEVADVSLRTIQRIEKSGIASQESAQSICAAYNITVEELLESENAKSESLKSNEGNNQNRRFNNKFLIPAIITFGMAGSFTFNKHEVRWLWESEPNFGIAFGVVSIIFWGLAFYKTGHSKAS